MAMQSNHKQVDTWRIVCIKKTMIPLPEPHVHVTGVGTGERPDWADLRWELAQVLEAMEEGNTFYIQTETDGSVIPAESANCPHCHQVIIRSTDGSEDGGALEALRERDWFKQARAGYLEIKQRLKRELVGPERSHLVREMYQVMTLEGVETG